MALAFSLQTPPPHPSVVVLFPSINPLRVVVLYPSGTPKSRKTDKYDNIQRGHVPKIPGTPFLRGKKAPAGAPKAAKSL